MLIIILDSVTKINSVLEQSVPITLDYSKLMCYYIALSLFLRESLCYCCANLLFPNNLSLNFLSLFYFIIPNLSIFTFICCNFPYTHIYCSVFGVKLYFELLVYASGLAREKLRKVIRLQFLSLRIRRAHTTSMALHWSQ